MISMPSSVLLWLLEQAGLPSFLLWILAKILG